MSEKKTLVPSSIWQRIAAFLDAGATGEIVLRVHRGKIVSSKLSEEVRATETTSEAPRATLLRRTGS